MSGVEFLECRGFTRGVKVLYSHDTLFGVLGLLLLAFGIIVRLKLRSGNWVDCDIDDTGRNCFVSSRWMVYILSVFLNHNMTNLPFSLIIFATPLEIDRVYPAVSRHPIEIVISHTKEGTISTFPSNL